MRPLASEDARPLPALSPTTDGRWFVDRGEVPEAALMDEPREIPEADIDRWSIDSDTPVGRLRHLGPTVRLSETPPFWARHSVPRGYHEPVWPARAA